MLVPVPQVGGFGAGGGNPETIGPEPPETMGPAPSTPAASVNVFHWGRFFVLNGTYFPITLVNTAIGAGAGVTIAGGPEDPFSGLFAVGGGLTTFLGTEAYYYVDSLYPAGGTPPSEDIPEPPAGAEQMFEDGE